MRVMIIGEQRVPWTAPGWARALRELGLDVLTWDWTPYYSGGSLGRVERRMLLGPAIARINRELIQAARRYKPHIVLLFAAWPILPDTVKALAGDFWVTGYHNDNPFGGFGRKAYFRYWKRAIPYFHSHHVFRSQNVEDYKRCGVRHVKVLLPYYLPWLDRPVTLLPQDDDLRHEIVFVGHAENDHRIEYVAALLDAGLPLKIYGYGSYWRRYLSRKAWKMLRPIELVEGSSYRKVIAGAKICLAFLSRSNRDECTFRVFEIPAVGGFLLAERTPTMQRLYEENSEAAYFSTPDEMVEQCQFYLQHDRKRAEVARAGHVRCTRSGYDVVSRMRQWLDDTSAWMADSSTNDSM